MMHSSDLAAAVEQVRRVVERRTAEHDLLCQRLAEVTQEVKEAERRLEDLEAERAFFEVVTQVAQETAKEQTENMVTHALQSVFGRRYSLKVELGTARSRPDAAFKVITADGDLPIETDPLEGKGGAVADVLALALRILLLEAAKPAIECPLLLDEPAKNVAEDYDPELAVFLTTVCADFGRQIIMVTHKQRLADAAQKVYRVVQEGGVSVVSERA